MKKYVFLITFLIINVLSLNSQPIPSGGQGHGTTNNQPGGGAPIDGGLGIILSLCLFYSIKKQKNNIYNKTNHLTKIFENKQNSFWK